MSSHRKNPRAKRFFAVPRQGIRRISDYEPRTTDHGNRTVMQRRSENRMEMYSTAEMADMHHALNIEVCTNMNWSCVCTESFVKLTLNDRNQSRL
ncbi:hypothetical protein AVEN_151469-1 [Araneus ventricosus]|uniref:Uncharacterized protein n=1 Tax=Araneus ventricosus TaxID=182803 RepID=A0A4Y2K900_ARAVE|nr:hypothetical protein AVEN_151469-1 [Araneus ventricosus]